MVVNVKLSVAATYSRAATPEHATSSGRVSRGPAQTLDPEETGTDFSREEKRGGELPPGCRHDYNLGRPEELDEI